MAERQIMRKMLLLVAYVLSHARSVKMEAHCRA